MRHAVKFTLAAEEAVLAAFPHAVEDLRADEQARWRRFIRPEAARTFLAGRALLRALVGAVSGRAPRDISFHLGKHGKPEVVGSDGLEISLTHSGLQVAAALAPVPVGIDMEACPPPAGWQAIARRFFPAGEHAALAALAPAAAGEEFLRRWTLREAVAKGMGAGVPALPDVPAPMATADAWAFSGDWAVTRLELPRGMVGHMAVPGAAGLPLPRPLPLSAIQDL